MQKVQIQVWDLPIRLFHWLLVITIILSYVSIEIGGPWADWHARLGAFALALIVFRLLWGFLGNRHALFKEFAPTPSRLKQYLNGEWQGIGHSPLGGMAVIGLLGLTSLIVITGLFANDDITLYGPLYPLVNQSLSEWFTGIHEIAFNALLLLIGLHLVAIAFYWLIKKNNLVKPMLTGKKEVESIASFKHAHDHSAKPLNFLISVAAASIVVWLVFGNVITDWFVKELPAQQTHQTPASQYQW